MAEKPALERLSVPEIEVRKLRSQNSMTIGGYAAVFNSLSDPKLGFYEQITPSFFNKSQGDGWPGVRALYEHQPAVVLGTVRARTLRLKTDDRGLDYEIDLAPSRADVYESVQRGDVYGSSVGFYTYQDEWRQGPGKLPVRYLVSGQLDHVSPTATPAYPDATVALRSLAAQFDADIDEVLRDARARELGRYFTRTDQLVSAPPSVEPAAMERRSEPASPALEAARTRNRHRAIEDNRQGRIDLVERLAKSQKRLAAIEVEDKVIDNLRRMVEPVPEARSLDGRDFYLLNR